MKLTKIVIFNKNRKRIGECPYSEEEYLRCL